MAAASRPCVRWLIGACLLLPCWSQASAQEEDPAAPTPRVLKPIDPGPDAPPGSLADEESSVGFGARVDLLVAAFDGELERERNRAGNKIDLDEELHFDDHQPGYALSAWLRLGTWLVLEGSYLRVASDSRGSSRDDFIWDDVAINRGDDVETDYTLQQALVGVRLRVLRERSFELGIPIGVLWNEQWLRIVTGPARLRAEGKVDTWSPYVGVQADASFLKTAAGALGLQARFLTFVYGYNHALTGFLDFAAYLTWGYEDYVRLYMGPRVFLQGSYRRSGRDHRQSFVELYAFDLGVSFGF